MNYITDGVLFWKKLKKLARSHGIAIKDLDFYLGLLNGTVEIMSEYGIKPRNPLIKRIKHFFGVEVDMEWLLDKSDESLILETNELFAVPGSKNPIPFRAPAAVMSEFAIETSPREIFGYFGMPMPDESMAGMGINRGDILIFCRQGVAEQSNIVAAMVGGRLMVRCYGKLKGMTVLRAKGRLAGAPTVYIEKINDENEEDGNEKPRPQKIKVVGKLICVVHDCA